MKKVLVFLAVFFAVLFYVFFLQSKNSFIANPLINPKEVDKIQPSDKRDYLFVPYWTFENNVESEEFDSLLYFGIGVNERGIDTSDPGYKKVGTFIEVTDPGKERILVVRMVDASVNSEIIKNEITQENIISDSISLAKEYGYDGILLDFETSAFGFENTIKNISDFYSRFAESVHNNNLLFYTSLFGDTYFRARAYDVSYIGKLSDKVFVMAYDFHKSRGNPGPNFPLKEEGKYGYDFMKMIKDYQRDVDNKKLVIVMGYFGYDWEIDGNGYSSSNGVPLSTNKIQRDFIDSCAHKSCTLIRNSSREPSLEYVSEDNINHILWFEDIVSVNEKLQYLSKQGVNQVGFWAYSYY